MLVMVGKVWLDSELYYGFFILVFVNSCVNLFIYGLSNKNYCNGYFRIMFLVCFKISGRINSNWVIDGSDGIVIIVVFMVESVRENLV